MNLDALARLLRPLSTRVSNLVGRGVVKAVDAAKKVQTLQVELLPGEVRDDLEHFQQYGFTARPLPESEVVVVFVNGRREHGLALGTEDRRYRIQNLESGEVAIYNHTGAKIVLKANGDVDVIPAGGGKINLRADTQVTGTLTASVDVVSNGVSLRTHQHSVQGGNGGGAVVFVPAGKTGGPA